MDVILLEKIANLGELGDKVSVKSGFARNFLLPQGKAQTATKENLANFEAKRAELEALAAKRLGEAEERAMQINNKMVTIEHRAGEEGKLFGSVTTHEVAETISASLITVHKNEIRMPDGPIKTIGEHIIQVAVNADVIANVTINVQPIE